MQGQWAGTLVSIAGKGPQISHTQTAGFATPRRPGIVGDAVRGSRGASTAAISRRTPRITAEHVVPCQQVTAPLVALGIRAIAPSPV